jgi:hypothetical protein
MRWWLGFDACRKMLNQFSLAILMRLQQAQRQKQRWRACSVLHQVAL